MLLELAAGVALVAVIGAVVMAGWRFTRTSNRKKMEALSALDGEYVVFWVSAGGGHAQFVLPQRGRLQVSPDDRSSVVLIGGKPRLVLLNQIRWIDHPKTGRRFGDRWHGDLRAG